MVISRFKETISFMAPWLQDAFGFATRGPMCDSLAHRLLRGRARVGLAQQYTQKLL